MKKVVCLLLALVLCFSIAALAVNVPAPSKMVSDMVGYGAEGFLVTVGNLDAQKAGTIELAKIRAAESLKSYFGTVKDANGDVVSLESMTLSELQSIFVSGYDASMGDAKVTMKFPTPYEKGEQVLVLVGIVETNARGGQDVEWTSFEGVGTGDSDSSIEVTLDAKTLLAVQEGVALVAVLIK